MVKGKRYAVRRATVSESPAVAGPEELWGSRFWAGLAALEIDSPVGGTPSHRPQARAKLCYDARFLYAVFLVKDRWVRAVEARYQGRVWTDSCVELFFTPGEDLEQGYFNIEVNCGGTALFKHRRERNVDVIDVEGEDAQGMAIQHTLPALIEQEILDPVAWAIQYRIPFAALRKYAPVVLPGPGVKWRANLYKCGDETSHPHWLAWSPIDLPRPDFHQKSFFGTLEFTE